MTDGAELAAAEALEDVVVAVAVLCFLSCLGLEMESSLLPSLLVVETSFFPSAAAVLLAVSSFLFESGHCSLMRMPCLLSFSSFFSLLGCCRFPSTTGCFMLLSDLLLLLVLFSSLSLLFFLTAAAAAIPT